MSEGDVDDVWQVIYSTRWISSLKNRATDCKSCFQKYKNSKITEKRSRLKCEDVVLWWRMNKAVEITGSGYQKFKSTNFCAPDRIISREIRRLEAWSPKLYRLRRGTFQFLTNFRSQSCILGHFWEGV